MKKKTVTKILSLLLVGAMATGMITGCGEKGKDKQAETGGNQNSEGEFIDYSEGFEEEVTIQIPVYDRAFEGWNPTDNYYTKWVQKEFGDKYNINVEYVAIGRSTEVADYMQMIAAGNAPDIIMNYDMPKIVDYYNEGAVQNISLEELEYYAPTYYDTLKDTIDTYGQVEDKPTFFFGERVPNNYEEVELVRLDWLEKVGMEVPTTFAEREEMAKAWKEAGLGTLGDRVWSTGFIYMYPFIKAGTDEKELAKYLDLTVAPLTWDVTKEYLENYNRLYNEGLYDAEFYLNKEDQDEKADFIAGRTGVYRCRMGANIDVFDSTLANDPNAKFAILPLSSKSPEGTCAYYENPPYGMIMGINADTTAEERAAVWMYLEWLIQPENLFYMQNGIEGETYNLDEDGIAVKVEGYTGEAKLADNMNKDYWCLVKENVVYDTEEKTLKASINQLAPKGYEYIIEDSYEDYMSYKDQGIITPIFTKILESYGEYAADLNAMWQEFYVECITCSPEEFDETYERCCQEYLEGGYQEVLDEKESYIEAGDYISVNK